MMQHKTESSKSYTAKLRHPRWQKKRLEVMSANDFACEVCGDSESTLHVHHKTYIKGREPWEYDDDQLAVLCESCHESCHASSPDMLADIVSRLGLDGPYSRETAAYLLAGFVGMTAAPRCPGDQVLLDVGAEAREAYWNGVREAAKRIRGQADES